jgi:hypothetical protein
MAFPGDFWRQNGLPKPTAGAQVVDIVIDIVNLILARVRECQKMDLRVQK